MTTDDDLIRRSDAVKALSPMLRDMISRGHACRIVAAVPRADLSPSPEVVKELVEALRAIIVAADKVGGYEEYHNAIDAGAAILAKLEGGE